MQLGYFAEIDYQFPSVKNKPFHDAQIKRQHNAIEIVKKIRNTRKKIFVIIYLGNTKLNC